MGLGMVAPLQYFWKKKREDRRVSATLAKGLNQGLGGSIRKPPALNANSFFFGGGGRGGSKWLGL